MLRLPPDRPFLLYAFGPLPHRPSRRFVRHWIEQIRASDDEVLRSAAVVRPHPTRMEEWSEVDLTDVPNVTLHAGHYRSMSARRRTTESLSPAAR